MKRREQPNAAGCGAGPAALTARREDGRENALPQQTTPITGRGLGRQQADKLCPSSKPWLMLAPRSYKGQEQVAYVVT